MYRNVQVHDTTQGEERTKRKEELRDAITRQMDLDAEDLKEDDQYLMELVLKMDSLEESPGESQEYWLLAITAAREACRLRQRGTKKRKRLLKTISQGRARNFILMKNRLRSSSSDFK